MTQGKGNISPTHSAGALKRLSSAPAELKLFMIFALVAVIIQFIVMFFFPFENVFCE